MKITIENTWPETHERTEERMVFTADNGAWDSSLADVVDLFAGLLKAMGFSEKQVDERVGDAERLADALDEIADLSPDNSVIAAIMLAKKARGAE